MATHSITTHTLTGLHEHGQTQYTQPTSQSYIKHVGLPLIGVDAQVNFGRQDILALKYMCEKLAKCLNIFSRILGGHVPPFSLPPVSYE